MYFYLVLVQFNRGIGSSVEVQNSNDTPALNRPNNQQQDSTSATVVGIPLTTLNKSGTQLLDEVPEWKRQIQSELINMRNTVFERGFFIFSELNFEFQASLNQKRPVSDQIDPRPYSNGNSVNGGSNKPSSKPNNRPLDQPPRIEDPNFIPINKINDGSPPNTTGQHYRGRHRRGGGGGRGGRYNGDGYYQQGHSSRRHHR